MSLVKWLLALLLLTTAAQGQTSPGFVQGQVLTAAALNTAFTGKLDVNNPTIGSVFKIDTSANIFAGATSALNNAFGMPSQVNVMNTAAGLLQFGKFGADAAGGTITFIKSRASAINTGGTINALDSIGYFSFEAYDSTPVTPVLQEAAAVQVIAGTPGTGTVPGQLRFLVSTGTGRFVDTEVLRLTQFGTAILHATAAIPSGGSTSQGLCFSSTSGFCIYWGSGAPTISAAQGSLYLRSDGTASTSLYLNTTGSTTWVAFTSP